MKKIFILCVCMCLLLCGCKEADSPSVNKSETGEISFDGYKGSADAVLTINDEDVSVDEFNYFLIMSAYDLRKANGSEENDLRAFFARIDEASKKTYAELAIEDAIKDLKSVLDSEDTVAIKDKTDALQQKVP